jgi:hypothetical protein
MVITITVSEPNDAGLLHGKASILNAMREVKIGQEPMVVPRTVPIVVEKRLRTAERIGIRTHGGLALFGRIHGTVVVLATVKIWRVVVLVIMVLIGVGAVLRIHIVCMVWSKKYVTMLNAKITIRTENHVTIDRQYKLSYKII